VFHREGHQIRAYRRHGFVPASVLEQSAPAAPLRYRTICVVVQHVAWSKQDCRVAFHGP
jgi:hypothetical protein